MGETGLEDRVAAVRKASLSALFDLGAEDIADLLEQASEVKLEDRAGCSRESHHGRQTVCSRASFLFASRKRW